MKHRITEITITWKPGITKINNITLKSIKALDQKGYYLLLGGLPYASHVTYKRLEPIYVGASFNKPIRGALLGYPDKNKCIKRFLDTHNKMDLLFTCGILEQPSPEAISPDSIQKVTRKLIAQINPACNTLSSEVSSVIEIEHTGMFNPTTIKTGIL